MKSLLLTIFLAGCASQTKRLRTNLSESEYSHFRIFLLNKISFARDCYIKESKNGVFQAGIIYLSLEIQKDGRPQNKFTIVEGDINDGTRVCLLNAFNSITYPIYENKSEYSVKFQPIHFYPKENMK